MTRMGARLAIEASWAVAPVLARLRAPNPALADPAVPAAYLTSVLHLPDAHAAALDGMLLSLLGPDTPHYRYPPGSMHVTLLGATGSSVGIDAMRADLAAGAQELGSPPLEVAIAGLAMGPGSLFAVLEPGDERFVRLRHRLRKQWGLADPARSIVGVADDLLHATLVRWTARPDTGLIVRLRRHRRSRMGLQPFSAIELVQTNKVMAEGRTTRLGHWPLPPDGQADPARSAAEGHSGIRRKR
jgi:2'-5' RNA ligase superfamily